MTDWYDRRHELRPGMEFVTHGGDQVMLDRRVPGDGTDWYCAVWYNGGYSWEDNRIHPSDLDYQCT